MCVRSVCISQLLKMMEKSNHAAVMNVRWHQWYMYYNTLAVYRSQYQVLPALDVVRAIFRWVELANWIDDFRIESNHLTWDELNHRFRVVKSGRWNVRVCVVKSLVNVKQQFHYFARKPSPANENFER